MSLIGLAWAVGGRIPRRVGDALAKVLAPAVALLPLPAVTAWEETAARAVGRPVTRRECRALVEVWIRNNLWSLSLARWDDDEVLSVVDITDADLGKLRSSLAGPGLVLALPHMGSWDFAGAWCARVGIKVVSVAERLPAGLYDLFRDARAGMGMDIYPVDQPDLMRALSDDIRAGKLVCLLSDRDLSSRGIEAAWGDAGTVKVPAGPALLARRTGADLRVATARYEGSRLRITVSEPITPDRPAEMMQGVVTEFASAVEESPTNWLMLRKQFL